MRDRLLQALREVARLSGGLPGVADVAGKAGVSEADVQRYLGPPENFAALLSFQQASAANETRIRILESAARVFAVKGMQKATLDEVAADAGVTKGAIYWHFKNKNDLFFSLLDHRFEQYTGPVAGDVESVLAQAGRDPASGLAQVFAQSLQRCTGDPEWLYLYFDCIAQARDPEVRARFTAIYERGWALSEALTETLQEKGLVTNGTDPRVLAIFWGALFDGLTMAWFINPDALDMNDLAGKIFHMLWQGLAPDAGGKKES